MADNAEPEPGDVGRRRAGNARSHLAGDDASISAFRGRTGIVATDGPALRHQDRDRLAKICLPCADSVATTVPLTAIVPGISDLAAALPYASATSASDSI
ncbi:hypothetical protein E4T56_gene6236 [Termitomyces sp. T112]|nr:hypothetical protein E4T56_gene6236 [Termitomyces sp. T112]